MSKLLQVWQWAPGESSEQNLDDMCTTALAFGFDGLLIKAMDGLDWHASYFGGQDALGSVEQAAQQCAYVNGRGLSYYVWTNPHYFADGQLEAQGRLYGQLASVCDGLALDTEPYPQFWGANQPVGAAQRFMAALRSVAPSARIIFQPDPRPARLAELRPEEWIPSCDVIAGQHYWTDFQTDPAEELAAASRLGLQWGKPVWPTLPGIADPASFPMEQIAGFEGFVVWRLGVTGPQGLQALGGLTLAQSIGDDPPADPNPADPSTSAPTYEDLASALGVVTHDYADGLETEANREEGPRPEQILGIVEKMRELSPT